MQRQAAAPVQPPSGGGWSSSAGDRGDGASGCPAPIHGQRGVGLRQRAGQRPTQNKSSTACLLRLVLIQLWLLGHHGLHRGHRVSAKGGRAKREQRRVLCAGVRRWQSDLDRDRLMVLESKRNRLASAHGGPAQHGMTNCHFPCTFAHSRSHQAMRLAAQTAAARPGVAVPRTPPTSAARSQRGPRRATQTRSLLSKLFGGGETQARR